LICLRVPPVYPEGYGIEDAQFEALLFPPRPDVPADQRPPDWSSFHLEMRQPNVMLVLLWDEYRNGRPTGLAIRGSVISIGTDAD
jgi:hypothetical protein